jgi:hypothetical protein
VQDKSWVEVLEWWVASLRKANARRRVESKTYKQKEMRVMKAGSKRWIGSTAMWSGRWIRRFKVGVDKIRSVARRVRVHAWGDSQYYVTSRNEDIPVLIYLCWVRVGCRTETPPSSTVSVVLRFPVVFAVLAGAGGGTDFKEEEVEEEGAGGEGAGFWTGFGFGLGRGMPCDFEGGAVECVAEAGAGAGAGAEAGLKDALLYLIDDLLGWTGATSIEGDVLFDKSFIVPEDEDAGAIGGSLVVVLDMLTIV